MQKKKAASKKLDVSKFDSIDKHTFAEIVDGNTAGSSQDDSQIDHDGVELSINGSDIEAFSDVDEDRGIDPNPAGGASTAENMSEGEIFSSDDDEPNVHRTKVHVTAKTARSTSTKRTSAGGCSNDRNQLMLKFQHLKNDPDFNQFLDSMLDQKLSDKTVEKGKKER